MSGYETVIGLELHAQLRTETKLFCRCRTRFSDPVLVPKLGPLEIADKSAA